MTGEKEDCPHCGGTGYSEENSSMECIACDGYGTIREKPDWKQEIIERVNIIGGSSWNVRLNHALNLAEEHFTKRIDTLDLEVENSYLEEISRLQAEKKELEEKATELRHELTLCRKRERDK